MKLQLKRSSALVNGFAKPPLASQLAFGEVAINYNSADPTIFIKDTNNSIVSFTDHLLPKAGGTLTGDIILNGDPTSSLMPATKQYTDNAISSVQSSITYPVTSVNNLTGAVSLDYTNVGAPSTSGANATGNNWNIGILGNSGSTTQLATARNIALTGDVTGNVNFNGTADVSITTTVADDSHNHVIANVDGLQAALNAKQDAASPATNSLALNGKADTDFVQTTNNTSLNSDSRNTRGVTRLYRRDADDDYSIQTSWNGTRWLLAGYNGDTYHAGAEVDYATNSGTSTYVNVTQDNSTNANYNLLFSTASSGQSQAKSNNDFYINPSTNILNAENLMTLKIHAGSNRYYQEIDCESRPSHGYSAIHLLNGTSKQGAIKYDVSNNVGFSDPSEPHNWLFKCDSNGNVTATADVTAYSDVSLKTNIELISKALDKVDQINGVTFERTDIDTNVRHAGVIAQDVQKVLPEVVREGSDGKLTVAYGNLVGLLVEAIKELRQEVNELKGK